MDEAPEPGLEDLGFELDGPGDRWLDQLRDAGAPRSLGRLGPYELLGSIRRGGQGVVFRARQPRTRRVIALKRLLAGAFATEAMGRRFEREVEAAATLKHPGIVTVYGMDVVDGLPLIAMEWIDGVPITEWCRADGGRPVQEVLEVFLRTCDAVQHAHSRGVLHRDLKPSNILVDAVGQPHVLDFGLAKRFASAAADGEAPPDSPDPGVSQSADFLGTPAYASPEQLQAGAERLDQRTDVYSLGVLLFELLTGSSPYPERDNVFELARAVTQGPPRRPSALEPSVGAELDTIVGQAMAVDRGERYPSVAALAGDVRRHLAGEAIEALPPSSWTLFLKLVHRNRLAAAFSLTVLLLLAVFAVYASWQAGRLQDERDEALEARRQTGEALALESTARREAERERNRARSSEGRAQEALGEATAARAAAERSAELAEAMRAFVTRGLLRGANPVHGEHDVTLVELLEETEPEIGERLGHLPAIQAEVRELYGDLYYNLGRFGEAETQLRIALDLREEVLEPDPLDLSAARRRLASTLGRLGRFVEAEELLHAAIGELRSLDLGRSPETGGPESPEAAGDLTHALSDLGAIYLQTARMVDGERLLRECIAVYEESGLAPDVNYVIVLGNLAGHLNTTGRPREAEEFARRAAEVARATLREGEPVRARALARLGWIRGDRGDLLEAEDLLREALALQRDNLGARHPHTAETQRLLAEVLVEFGELEEADGLLDEALETLRLQPPSHRLGLGNALASHAALLKQAGRYGETLEVLQEVRAIRVEVHGERHVFVGNVDNQIGLVSGLLGRWPEAEAAFRRALESMDAYPDRNSRDDRDALMALCRLAEAVVRQGRFAEALELAREAVDQAETVRVLEPGELARTLGLLGEGLFAAGDAEAAAWALERSLELWGAAGAGDAGRLAELEQLLARAAGAD